MKIQQSNTKWRALSEKITSFLKAPPRALLAPKKWNLQHNCFLSWPRMPKRLLSTQSGFSPPPKIDIKIIEKFLHRHKQRQNQEPIIHSSFNDRQGLMVHQALAVDKMVLLIGKTISDIKAVELIHICHKKG